MADDLKTAGDTQLEAAIINAQATLNGAFGPSKDLEGQEAYRFVNLDDLMKVYSLEAEDIQTVADSFLEISNAIKKMRSSYLPVEFFKDETGSFEATLADMVSEQESYENTFMRMLGMPSTSETRLAETNDLIYIDSDGVAHEEVSFEEVEREILDQRQKKRCERSVTINNSIYNINNLNTELIDTIKAGEDAVDIQSVFAGSYTTSEEEEEKASQEARITSMEQDLFKFSYLLLPAVQDGRVSDCINEPEKIVAGPFSPVGGRVVNENKIKPSLLESVIRIRMDRLSGTDTFRNVEGEEPDEVAGITVGEDDLPVNTNSYGILESLFILRLNAAVGGLANKLAEDIEDFIELSESIRLTPEFTECKEQDNTANDPLENADPDPVEEALNEQLLIEDAIMSLLGENGEVLDLQVQTQRNSSIHDAHLMSSLVGVIDLPRKRIQKTLDVKEEDRKSGMDVNGEEKETRINTSMGVANGVGVIDIAVFSLALFAMSEEGLLGLLSEQAYENLQKNDYAGLPISGVLRHDMIDAINEYTSLVIAGYKLFQVKIGDQDQDVA
nr:hypothetical protein 103 [bacterium]